MRSLVICTALMLALVTRATAPSAPQNPLLEPSTLPFGAPRFDRIGDADYLPAIQAGMAAQRSEIAAIAGNSAPPTFDNTLRATEKSGQFLERVMNVFSAVAEANTNPTLQRTREVIAPQLAAHQDAIYLNARLFSRVRAVYRALNRLRLDPESRQLVKVYYERFVHAGATLPPEKQARLREINKQLATLQAAFQRKLLAGTASAALVVRDKSELAGLSDAQIGRCANRQGARLSGLDDSAPEHHAAAGAAAIAKPLDAAATFRAFLDANGKRRCERHALDDCDDGQTARGESAAAGISRLRRVRVG